VPLIVQGELLGSLNLMANEPDIFGEEYMQIAREVGNQLAIAIQQARLFETERDQRALAEALRDTSATLASTLDSALVMDRILDNVGHVVQHAAANLMLIRGDSAYVAYSRGYKVHETFRKASIPLSTPNIRRMIETGVPLVIPDTGADPEWQRWPETSWVESYVGAPLRVRGVIIGFLNLVSETRGFFEPLQAERLQAFADQAAVAIENAELYDKLQQHAAELEKRVAERTRDLHVVAEVSRQITTVLEIDKLLSQLVERTLQEFNLYDVSVFLVDETGQALRATAGASIAGRHDRSDGRSLDLTAQSAVPRAAFSREPVCINDVLRAQGFSVDPALPDTRSELALPMTVGPKLIGVLDLRAAAPNRFMADSVRTFRNLAEQIGIAVRNAQLFAQVEKAQREAQAAQKVAEEANRAKSQFLANMSHELRTPLNAILNFTAFVSDGVFGPVNAEQADALQQAVSSGKHLLSLINDILDLTKIEVGLMDLFVQEVDFNEALTATVSMAKGLVKDKPLELITDIDRNLPHTFGDRRRIRQVFLNLVSNAVKFTPQGRITITAHHEGDGVHIAVDDTGIGIESEDMALIFETFRQAEHDLPEVVGTGLGLPISKFFVEAHGGTLWVDSTPGKGSTFHVTFPIRTKEEADAANRLASTKG
jgi:signal transduction histidine kinase